MEVSPSIGKGRGIVEPAPVATPDMWASSAADAVVRMAGSGPSAYIFGRQAHGKADVQNAKSTSAFPSVYQPVSLAIFDAGLRTRCSSPFSRGLADNTTLTTSG